MIRFIIHSDFIELFKLLKANALCDSGGEAKQAVAQGEVMVNGEVETRKSCKIRPGDRVEFAGETILVEKGEE